MRAATPVMLFDGTCGFCRRWVERWRDRTAGRVRFIPYQEEKPFFLSRRALERSVHLLAPEGIYRGAHAVFRALAESPGRRWTKGWGLRAYRHLPLFSIVSEAAYSKIARHRVLASKITRLFYGSTVRPSRFGFARRVFFFGVGVSAFAAFTSLAVQVRGLIGEKGILPAAAMLERLRETLGKTRLLELPTLFWFDARDEVLLAACVLGAGLSLLVAAQVAWGPLLLVLWALYLSLVNVGGVFLAFQWDALLIEVLLFAALLAPWLPRRQLLAGEPSKIARFAVLALLFKLHFMSGLVKILSHSPTWKDLTALQYHYWTQPLPNPLSPLADRMPQPVHAASTLYMFAAEFLAPFLLFGPRRLRHLGAGMIALLQVGIVTTGNYGFFNLLSLSLCALAIDDAAWRSLLPSRLAGWIDEDAPPPRFRPTDVLRGGLGLALVTLSAAPLWRTVSPTTFPGFLRRASASIAQFRSANAYGLFAVMTTERKEIELEGSEDGVTWKRYEFRYKPSPGDETLPTAHAHMPRVDWQMWFAALGSCRGNPWFLQLQQRLLEGASPEVSRLFARDPFRGGPPPRFLRTPTYDVRFRRGGEGEDGGESERIWTAREEGPYCPMLLLDGGQLRAIRS